MADENQPPKFNVEDLKKEASPQLEVPKPEKEEIAPLPPSPATRPMPPPPSPTPQGPSFPSPTEEITPLKMSAPPILEGRETIERIEEIAESIIQEKWQDFKEKTGDIQIWKEKLEIHLASVKQELIRTNHRFLNLESAVLKKVTEYSKTMESVNTEIKTLEKVFEEILEPLTTSIKELKKITENLKK